MINEITCHGFIWIQLTIGHLKCCIIYGFTEYTYLHWNTWSSLTYLICYCIYGIYYITHYTWSLILCACTYLTFFGTIILSLHFYVSIWFFFFNWFATFLRTLSLFSAIHSISNWLKHSPNLLKLWLFAFRCSWFGFTRFGIMDIIFRGNSTIFSFNFFTGLIAFFFSI